MTCKRLGLLCNCMPSPPYFYSTYSLSTSFSDSTIFLDSINQHLSSSSESAVVALQDCQLLFDLNIDFLSSANSSLSSSSSSQLADSQAETLQAMLDAVLTNQQTCLQSLQETASSTVQNDLSTSLANGTKLSSVSLAFFKHAWTNPNKKPSTNNGSKGPSSILKKPKHSNNKPGNGRKLLLFHEAEVGPNGELPLKMSSKNLETFEKRTGRKLLQSSSGSVLVTDMMIVIILARESGLKLELSDINIANLVPEPLWASSSIEELMN